MKNDSEKFYEGFRRFLAEQGHEEPSEAEMDALLRQYVTMLNAGDVSLEPMQDEESADAFLERAQEAGSRREMLKWIRKARELEPDHVDAALMEIEETSKNPYEQEMRLFGLQQKAEKQLREQGYFRKASIGDFWGLIETRPYMRVCCRKVLQGKTMCSMTAHFMQSRGFILRSMWTAPWWKGHRICILPAGWFSCASLLSSRLPQI